MLEIVVQNYFGAFLFRLIRAIGCILLGSVGIVAKIKLATTEVFFKDLAIDVRKGYTRALTQQPL